MLILEYSCKQCKGYSFTLMPRQRLVPVDPEQQPPIRTFISECRKAGLTGATSRRIATKVVNKKRHLSTDDRKGSEKRKPTSSTDQKFT